VKLSSIGIAKSAPEGCRHIIVRASTVKIPTKGWSQDGGGQEKVKVQNQSEISYEGANVDLLWISACSSTRCLQMYAWNVSEANDPLSGCDCCWHWLVPELWCHLIHNEVGPQVPCYPNSGRLQPEMCLHTRGADLQSLLVRTLGPLIMIRWHHSSGTSQCQQQSHPDNGSLGLRDIPCIHLQTSGAAACTNP